MFTRLFTGLRLRLFLLVLLVCAPLAAAVLHSAWDGRRTQRADWSQRSQSMMRLAARDEARLIGQTKQLLLAVAESSQVRSGNRRECKRMLEGLIGSYPRYANLGVLNTNGELLASALPLAEPTSQPDPQRGAERLVAKPTMAPPPPPSPFDHRLFHRVLETRAFEMAALPSDRTNSQPIIDFAQPVFDAFGQVQAVVVAALDLNWVNRFESELASQLPNGATWTEVDRNGTILVRHPSPEKWFGQSYPETTLLKNFFSEPQGVVEVEDATDGLVLHSFATMPSRLAASDVVTILSIAEPVLFAGVDRMLFRNLTALGIAAILALFLGWMGSQILVLRPVKALARSSARLAAGDLTARTGLPPGQDELGQLTRTFDQMAQVLERHETERERTKNKLQVLSRRLVTAQENERRHIARELHDQIGQALTVAQMNLQAALESAKDRERTSRLRECLDVVESTLVQVHDLSLNLRPSMLDDLGLEPALRWLTERQASLADLHFEIHAEHLSNHLDSMVKTECFRVAQEALTNIVRHAKARSVTVELKSD